MAANRSLDLPCVLLDPAVAAVYTRYMSDTAVVPEWSLADRLIKARRWAGLEQEDLAADFGMTRQAISKWERGISVPRLVVIKQWAARCGVSLEWLLGQPVPSSSPPPATAVATPEPTPLSSAKRGKRGKVRAPSTKWKTVSTGPASGAVAA